MMSKKTTEQIKIGAVLIFVYVLLFEFILLPNTILPKPSLLIEAFVSIWKDYNLLISFIETLSMIAAAHFFGIIILWLLRKPIGKLIISNNSLFQSFSFFSHFNLLFVIVLAGFWFQSSIIVLSVFVVAFQIVNIISALSNKKNLSFPEYEQTALNLTGIESDLTEVRWKSLLPEIFKEMISGNSKIILVILVYEYINLNVGLGHVVHQIWVYKDFTGLFCTAIIIFILSSISKMGLIYLKNKFAFWE